MEAVKKISGHLGNAVIVQKGLVDLVGNNEQGDPSLLFGQTVSFSYSLFIFVFFLVLKYEVQGSLRRCGGQGDILSGSLATFAAWSHIYRKEKGTALADEIDVNLLSGIGACAMTKNASVLAFSKLGRSFTASDMVNEIHLSFDFLFPSNL